MCRMLYARDRSRIASKIKRALERELKEFGICQDIPRKQVKELLPLGKTKIKGKCGRCKKRIPKNEKRYISRGNYCGSCSNNFQTYPKKIPNQSDIPQMLQICPIYYVYYEPVDDLVSWTSTNTQ